MNLAGLKRDLGAILSSAKVKRKCRNRYIKLITCLIDEEYTEHCLHIGYMAPLVYYPRQNRYRRNHKDAKCVSFFTMPEFLSMNLNRIVFMAGGIDKHAADPIGTAKRIERELERDTRIHMTVESLRRGKHDNWLQANIENGFATGMEVSNGCIKLKTISAGDFVKIINQKLG